VVAVHRDEPWLEHIVAQNLLPWPRRTHAEHSTNGLLPWLNVQAWFEGMRYEPLDAKSKETACGSHELHFVPCYGKDRYLQVSQIPGYSGRSAYENNICPSCGLRDIPEGLVLCPSCGGVMRNRPYVEGNGQAQLIKGFRSSYRRMNPQRPAYTVTTASSHVGSDFKIHPWEHRVLSILECADLQTVPRSYDWSRAHCNGTKYLVRALVGEAFPPYFTYLHGRLLSDLLSGVNVPDDRLAPMSTIGEYLDAK
jgi:DNA (cytosine-5)-methyltransferase 1